MPRMLTVRALLVAALAVGAGSWLLQRVELVYGGPLVAVGALGALPVGLLALLAALRGRLGLERGELLAIYLVAAIGLPLASTGWVQYVLPGLVTGTYMFADESGRYHAFLQEMPAWLLPRQEGAVAGFFEGNMAVPWGAWLLPLSAWALLAAGFSAALWGLCGLLQQRWLEEEHLRFPLAELPLELVERGEVLLRERLLWAGALVPFLLYGINGLEHYFGIPGEIPQDFDFGEVLLESPWRAMAPFTSRFVFYFSPLLVGLVYLMSVEIAFSTWFFFLCTRLQLLVSELVGRSEDAGVFVGLGGQWREWPNFFPHLQAQARGGLFCVALLSLWAARGALGRAWKAALGGRGDERRALLALVLGSLVLAGWGWAAGLSPWLSALHVLLVLLGMVGMMRLRLDGGLPVVGLYFLSANLFYFALGTGPGAFLPREYAAFAWLTALSYTGIGALAMVHFEGARMARSLGTVGGRLGWVLVAGVGLGLVAGCVSLLDLVYERGLFALDQQGAARAVARVGRYYHYLYSEAGTRSSGADWDRLGALVFGFGATGLLAFLRLFFLRFPFHPLGYIFGTGMGTVLWGSALVGWAIKALVVRYGGAATYRRLRPFFLGMVGGELAMRLLWAGLAFAGAPGSGYDWW